MEILLVRPVENLGEPGDVVEVKRGYARNYLFPQGFAVEPTQHNIEGVKKVRDARMQEIMEREQAAKVLAEKLDREIFTFERKIHDDNKLYNSVRPEEIAAAIAEDFGTEIERSRVHIDAPIEELGSYPITISLYKDITAEIQVNVVEEGALSMAQEEPSAEAAKTAESESAEA